MSTDPADMAAEINYLNEQLDKAHKEIAVLRDLVEDAQRVLRGPLLPERWWRKE